MRILFLGEGDFSGPARYLAAILRWAKLPFDHQPDQAAIPAAWLKRRYDAVIISDYRYVAWTRPAKSWLQRSVHSGTGLMMLGGWAAFTGLVGGYAGTEIEALLPVRCVPRDDRVNRPALLPITKKLAAVVNGYNRVQLRPGYPALLEFQDIHFKRGELILGARQPALVTGQHGQGRTVAFMTDCAPHWAGGLVDLGSRRVAISLARQGLVEVGTAYLEFFQRWIHWASRRT